MNVAREHVEFTRDSLAHFKSGGAKILGDPTVVYEFLLAHGQECMGTRWTKFRGRGYRKMDRGFCFSNAFQMSLMHDELTYYEGYATTGLLPMHHAWCVDEEGRVVDPTWRKRDDGLPEEEWEYFGVGLDSESLASWWFAKSDASVLFDLDYGSNVEELIAIVEAA